MNLMKGEEDKRNNTTQIYITSIISLVKLRCRYLKDIY